MQWRLQMQSYKTEKGVGEQDSGGIVVASTADVATIEPIGSMQFPCVFSLEPSSLAYLVNQLPGVLEEMRAAGEEIAVVPTSDGESGKKWYDEGSPYEFLRLRYYDSKGGEQATLSFGMRHAGLEYAQHSYPFITDTVQTLQRIVNERGRACQQPAFPGVT